MEFEDLRIIVLDERESGKLSEIPPDIFEKAGGDLSQLCVQAQSIDNFLTNRASELLNEIDSMKETLQDIVFERFKKILKLAMNQTGAGNPDKAELKKMLPAEKEMFDQIISAIEICHNKLIDLDYVAVSDEQLPVHVLEAGDLSLDTEVPPEGEGAAVSDYVLVHVLKDMEPFMGVDGRVYSLRNEDVVTLPKMNASVLYGRNIALNIRVGK
ncbi:MAG: DNA replication complex GINS family protein [Methanogenium sp.]|nr:DNA replication complex GINS family protein [Methanogenium sp.]